MRPADRRSAEGRRAALNAAGKVCDKRRVEQDRMAVRMTLDRRIGGRSIGSRFGAAGTSVPSRRRRCRSIHDGACCRSCGQQSCLTHCRRSTRRRACRRRSIRCTAPAARKVESTSCPPSWTRRGLESSPTAMGLIRVRTGEIPVRLLNFPKQPCAEGEFRPNYTWVECHEIPELGSIYCAPSIGEMPVTQHRQHHRPAVPAGAKSTRPPSACRAANSSKARARRD